MLLFIYGEDAYRSKKRLDYYRDGFLKKYGDFNVSVYEDDFDFPKIKNDIMSFPFMAEKRLVILKGILKSKKEIQEKILEILGDIPEETVTLFFEEGSPDKRTAIFKKLSKEKHVEIFDKLEGAEIIRWIKKEVYSKGGEIDNQAANTLASFVGNELYQLDSELQKLISFNKIITTENVKKFIKANPETNIFDMVDSIGKRDLKSSFRKVNEAVKNGENEIYLLSMINRQIKNLLLVKDLKDKGLRQDEMAKVLKIHPFVVKKSADQASNYTLKELRDIYDFLVETDVSIKKGLKEPRLAIDLLIQKICS